MQDNYPVTGTCFDIFILCYIIFMCLPLNYAATGHVMSLSVQIAVPRSMIGVVIGKGGEMIKKIQQESGARIQFRPEDELGGPNRMCNITGSQEQTQAAHNMIQELVDNTAVCYFTVTVSMSLCVCVVCLSYLSASGMLTAVLPSKLPF